MHIKIKRKLLKKAKNNLYGTSYIQKRIRKEIKTKQVVLSAKNQQVSKAFNHTKAGTKLFLFIYPLFTNYKLSTINFQL